MQGHFVVDCRAEAVKAGISLGRRRAGLAVTASRGRQTIAREESLGLIDKEPRNGRDGFRAVPEKALRSLRYRITPW